MTTEPKHEITIHLSDAAQRAALLAGEPAHTPQTYAVPVELLPRLLALPWAVVQNDGRATCAVPKHGVFTDFRLNARPADTAAALDAIDALLVLEHDRVDADREAAAQREAERREERESDNALFAAKLGELQRRYLDGLDEETAETAGRAFGLSSWQLYDRGPLAAECQAEKERRRAAKEAREKARASIIEADRAAIIEALGDASQRARYAEGLLPEAERKELIRDALLLARSWPQYTPITAGEIEHKDTCGFEDPTTVTEVDEEGLALDAARFAQLQRIREAAQRLYGTVTVTLRRHRVTCTECQARVKRYGVRVRVERPSGLSAAREYALDGDKE